MAHQIPVVDYLELGDVPRLVANRCTVCAAQFFDRRNACANCSGTTFDRVPLPTKARRLVPPTSLVLALPVQYMFWNARRCSSNL